MQNRRLPAVHRARIRKRKGIGLVHSHLIPHVSKLRQFSVHEEEANTHFPTTVWRLNPEPCIGGVVAVLHVHTTADDPPNSPII